MTHFPNDQRSICGSAVDVCLYIIRVKLALGSSLGYSSESPLSVCPIRLFCLFLIVCIRDLSPPIIASTYSFVVCSVQLIFSIFLYDRTSKASIHFVSSYSRSTSLIHRAPLHSTYLFVASASSDTCLVYFSVILSSLRNCKCLFPIAVLLISLWHLASVEIILPRYQHSFTCSVSFPSMCRPILTTVFSLLILTTIVLFDSCHFPHSFATVFNISSIVY